MTGYCDCSNCAGVNNAFDARTRRGLEKTSSAFYVVLVNLIWVSRPQPVIGGDVKDLPSAMGRSVQRPGVAQVSLYAFNGQSLERLQIAALADQYTNRMTGGHKLTDNVASHEPGGARDKNAHRMGKPSFT
jgi:hypothetical protein